MALIENKKQLIVFIIAVAIGLLAAGLMSYYVQNSVKEQTAMIARKFQKEQTQKDEIYRQQMDGLNQKISQVEQRAQQAAQDAARAAADQMAKINTTKQEKKFVALALRIPAGKRAITVMIESLGAVGGLVSPGDYVDVIAQLTMPAKGLGNDSMTAMIFQNLQILAINTNIDQSASYEEQQKDRALKITFAVTPEEASLLSFAEKNGKISLSLRRNLDNKSAMISAATWSTLAEYVLQNTGADLAPKVPVPVVEAPVEEPTIQVYKSGRGSN